MIIHNSKTWTSFEIVCVMGCHTVYASPLLKWFMIYQWSGHVKPNQFRGTIIKMAAMLQVIFLKHIEKISFHSELWSGLFPSIKISIMLHWIRWWLGAKQEPSHDLNQWWSSSVMHVCSPSSCKGTVYFLLCLIEYEHIFVMLFCCDYHISLVFLSLILINTNTTVDK